MKRILLIFIAISVLLPDTYAERKKIGLVLSGGGAKGMAHIGTLKVLEKAGIPIDYIAGTSIGSIIGGLYAIGYDANQIDSLARAQDWPFLLSDRVNREDLLFSEKEDNEKYLLTINLKSREQFVSSGLIRGQNIHNLFSDLTVGYHGLTDFQKFPIPFACISTNIVDRSEVVFKEGNIVTAMLASMSIPGVFVPVRIDSMVLVDGGLVNNFPVDVVKQMGADIVIGVDVQTALFGEKQLQTLPDMMAQIINILCLSKYDENKLLTDLHIQPDITGYSAASFSKEAVDTLIQRGEEAGNAVWEKLMELRKEIGLKDDEMFDHPMETVLDSFLVRNIYVKGVYPEDEKWIRKIIKHKDDKVYTVNDIKYSIALLYGTRIFTSITYNLTNGPDGYDLELNFEKNKSNVLNFGFRFDSEEMAAVVLNTKIYDSPFSRSSFSLTARLSKSPFINLDYFIENPFFRRLNISYMFRYNDFNIYTNGKRTNVNTFRYHRADIGYTNYPFRNLKLKLGMKYEYFDYDPSLYSDENYILDIESQGYINYYAQAHLETYDRRYYPTKGFSFNAVYTVHTDNFIRYEGNTPFSSLNADFGGVFPLSDRLKFIPSVSGRMLFGKNIAYPYFNYIGGEINGRYMAQQMAFSGINYVELADKFLFSGKVSLRQRMGRRHYLSLTGNYALQENDLGHILEHKGIIGGSIGYSYDLVTGPIDIKFSMSDKTKDLIFYFNLGYYF